VDALTKLVATVPGATRWVDGEREADIRKLLEDEEFVYPLSSGERARVYLWAQLFNGYTPSVLRDEGWDFGRAAAALDQDGQVALIRVLQRIWGVSR